MRVQRSAGLACLCLLLSLTGPAAAEWGHLKGRFTYEGEAPKPRQFPITLDTEAFAKAVEDKSLIVNPCNQGIANVVVYLLPPKDVKLEVHPSYAKQAREPVEVTASQGEFSPRIVLARTGQPVVEVNRDKVAHAMKIDAFFNSPRGSLLPIGRRNEHTYPSEERVPIPVSCHIHPWELSYLLVLSNPYMAKTDANGRFKIDNLPAGRHTFQVWHERSHFLRDVDCGPVATDPKGRFSIDIRPGATETLAAAVPPSLLAAEEEDGADSREEE